jgi:hypothetical protein
VTTCELTLDCGFVAKGKVREETCKGSPSQRQLVEAANLRGYTYTDQDGGFTITNAPEGKAHVELPGEAIVRVHFDLDLRSTPPSAICEARRRSPSANARASQFAWRWRNSRNENHSATASGQSPSGPSPLVANIFGTRTGRASR